MSSAVSQTSLADRFHQFMKPPENDKIKQCLHSAAQRAQNQNFTSQDRTECFRDAFTVWTISCFEVASSTTSMLKDMAIQAIQCDWKEIKVIFEKEGWEVLKYIQYAATFPGIYLAGLIFPRIYPHLDYQPAAPEQSPPPQTDATPQSEARITEMQNRIVRLVQAVGEKNTRIQELENQASQSTTNQSSQLTALTNERNQLQQELADAKEAERKLISEHEKIKNDLETKFEELEGKFDEKIEELNELQIESSKFKTISKQELGKKKSEITALIQKVNTLEKTIKEMEKENVILSEENQSLFERKEEELKRAKEDLNFALKEMNDFSEASSKKDETIKNLQTKYDDLLIQILSIEEKITLPESAKENIKKVDTYTGEEAKKSLKSNINVLNQQYANIKKLKTALNTVKKEIEDKNKTILEYRNQLSNSLKEKNSSIETIENLSKALEQREKTIEKINEKNGELEFDNLQLRNENKDLLDQIDEVEEENEQLKERIAELEKTTKNQ